MSEAEFERRQGVNPAEVDEPPMAPGPDYEPAPRSAAPAPAAPSQGRGTRARAKPAKPRRVQRMFAIEEELDKKLWLYAIHIGKDRSDVVNDLLRPMVASMVLYDSRDRRAAARAAEPAPEGQGGTAEEQGG